MAGEYDDFFGTSLIPDMSGYYDQGVRTAGATGGAMAPAGTRAEREAAYSGGSASTGSGAIGTIRNAFQQYLGRDAGDDAAIVQEHFGGNWNPSQQTINSTLQSIQNSPEAQAYRTRTAAEGTLPAYPGTGGSVIPPDLFDLRNQLGYSLLDMVKNWKPTPYGGDLNLPIPGQYGEAADMFRSSYGQANQAFDRASGSLDPLQQLAQTGGAPDITSALDAIRQRGLMDIEDQNAQIREKFGAWGLGHGSDVSEALARGSSRGIADINAQQSSLVSQIMSAAQDRRLSAASALPQIATQIGTARAGVGSQAGAGLLGVGGAEQSVKESNLARNYAEFVRLQQPNPYLGQAVNYATGFPPVKPAIPGQQGSDWLSATIGGGASVLSSILPFLLFSDRNMKEDIAPADPDEILSALMDLPIYRWRYKGDANTHVGPMAQDFQSAFGVGDGKTLHPIDIVGVMVASQKAMAEKVVGRGKTPGAK